MCNSPKNSEYLPYFTCLCFVSKMNYIYLQVNPLSEIDKILDCEMRPYGNNETDDSKEVPKQKFVKQYLVKWKRLSYLHCSW